MKNIILFSNQSLTRFTTEIFSKILRIFFVGKNRNFHMHCEQMADCRYSQVEIMLLKISFRNLE